MLIPNPFKSIHPNASTLLEFANLQMASEALYVDDTTKIGFIKSASK